MLGHQIITSRKIGPYIQISPQLDCQKRTKIEKKYANDARTNTIVCGLHS